ncbi:MAG: PrsW family intramembrane metalloprotease [Candidatus Nealsonbacteria bacterium]|nr:PrsW family intramembrane metalloprotease [Candidatus Nealsonbacteria bacterium]
MAGINYPLYLLFGLAPSVIWLLFFLRKDSHPESNGMIIKIFLYGMLAAVPAALVEIGFFSIIKSWPIPLFYLQTIYIFLGIAFTEEIFKYLVVQKKILKDSALDEPVDLMLFMIISALGFAALENMLILFPLANPFMFVETVVMSGFRFVGATFLHALASGLIGYFMAVALCGPKQKRFRMIALGITLAAFLHGLYDFSIIEIEGNIKFAIPLSILFGLTVFVTWGFTKVKKLKSVCNT